MSLTVEEREKAYRVKQGSIVELRPSRRIIVTRPGSRAHVMLHVGSPHKLEVEVRLAIEGLNANAATYTLSPDKAKTPFTSKLELTTNPNAVGIYPFKVIALDSFNNTCGTENLVLIILPQNLPLEILGHLRTILRMYRLYGIQYVLWYIALYLYKDRGLSFKEIKTSYELLKKKRLSNGTIGDLIGRMTRKGILIKRRERYYPGVEDEELVLEVIDSRRVRSGRIGAKKYLKIIDNQLINQVAKRGEAIPKVVEGVLQKAWKLVEQKRIDKALGLIQHTLIGVRETGHWILWVKDIFIYREKKAKPPFHYFCSEKLASILETMGIKQGFIHTKPVNDLIHNMFPRGYREARRVHYLLKKLNWLSYGQPLVLYIAVYRDGTGGFKLEDLEGRIILAINYYPWKAVKINKSLVMPEEHVDRDNDETYFRYR